MAKPVTIFCLFLFFEFGKSEKKRRFQPPYLALTFLEVLEMTFFGKKRSTTENEQKKLEMDAFLEDQKAFVARFYSPVQSSTWAEEEPMVKASFETGRRGGHDEEKDDFE